MTTNRKSLLAVALILLLAGAAAGLLIQRSGAEQAATGEQWLAVKPDPLVHQIGLVGKIEPDTELLGDAAALGGVSKYVARVKCAMLAWVAAEDALRKLDS